MSSHHPAIRVSNLGKKYQLGGPQEQYLTLRDAIVNSVKAPFKRINQAPSDRGFWALKDVQPEDGKRVLFVSHKLYSENRRMYNYIRVIDNPVVFGKNCCTTRNSSTFLESDRISLVGIVPVLVLLMTGEAV